MPCALCQGEVAVSLTRVLWWLLLVNLSPGNCDIMTRDNTTRESGSKNYWIFCSNKWDGLSQCLLGPWGLWPIPQWEQSQGKNTIHMVILQKNLSSHMLLYLLIFVFRICNLYQQPPSLFHSILWNVIIFNSSRPFTPLIHLSFFYVLAGIFSIWSPRSAPLHIVTRKSFLTHKRD